MDAVGNYQDPMIIKKCKAERRRFGSFYYRYPHGESASDVVRLVFNSILCVKRESNLSFSGMYLLYYLMTMDVYGGDQFTD